MTPKLSSLSQSDKNKLCAELDGWTDISDNWNQVKGKQMGIRPNYPPYPNPAHFEIPSYTSSYDAIIPLIQKQNRKMVVEIIIKSIEMCGKSSAIDATSSQLVDATLIATGKAEL